MTEITVRHEPATGVAVIEIRGAETGETRFRLRDPASGKYLGKRGWTKTTSFLPVDAVPADGALTLTLDADLAGKIPDNTLLSLEQPASGFEQALTWPDRTPDSTIVPPVASPVADDPQPVPEKQEPAPAPLLLEPAIMHEHLHDDPAPEEAADNDNRRGSWKPAAIAAALFFVLGIGLGYLWLGSDGAAIKQAERTAAMQLEKQKWEFDRQLAAAKEEVSAASEGKLKASDAEFASLSDKSDQLSADRDAAQKALADKEAVVQDLQQQLADAKAQIAAVGNAAGDKAKAQIAVLDKKITALTAELDKTNAELAQRDQMLRDAQARLTEANAQVAAVKDAAQKESEALNDDLTRKTDSLTAEAEKARQQLASRDGELRDARASLAAANNELAAARQSAKDASDAQNTALSEKITALTAQVKQSEQQLGEREKALRDAQAKLSVANVQIDALKIVAGKSTEAGMEKTELSEKIDRLTGELDKAGKDLAERQTALTEANLKLKDADARLEAANKRNEQLSADRQEQGQPPVEAASNEAVSRLQEERDLYASELKKMTASFTALQAEKADLEKTVAELKAGGKQTDVAAAQISSKAIWGATAIDQTGTIYSLQNQTTKKIAEENVAALCRGKSRSRCEALASYSNACFSLARFEGENPASDNYAYFVNKDWKIAARAALERCESMGVACTLRFTACSPDGLSKPISD